MLEWNRSKGCELTGSFLDNYCACFPMMAVSSASKNMLILKKIKNPINKEDLELLKDLEEAYEELERGEFKVKSKNEFLKELRKW